MSVDRTYKICDMEGEKEGQEVSCDVREAVCIVGKACAERFALTFGGTVMLYFSD